MGKPDVKLEVLISTLGRDGIERVARMVLPRVDGVRYLVSWQKPEGELPQSLNRTDLSVYRTSSLGISSNRNDAFDVSTAELLLIADDDLNYTEERLRSVISTMDAHPEVDLATFRHDGGDGKTYPECEFDLKDWAKNYYVTSFEIALRRHVVFGENRVRYDVRFGPGAPRFKASDEAFFVDDVVKAGYNCRFFPITVVTHPGKTNSHRYLTSAFLESQGVYIRSKYKWYSAWVRIPLVAWRHYKARRYTLFPAIWFLFRGWTFKR